MKNSKVVSDDANSEATSDEAAVDPVGKAKAKTRPRSNRRAYLSAEERKQQILRAAQEAFSQSSLHGVSTRDIAKAADINPASLFEHFGTKDALFREAVIAPLFKQLGEMKGRVSVYQAASQQHSVDLARAGVQRQMGEMKRLFPLFTTALFSDLELGKTLYRDHMIPLIEERVKMTIGLAKPETDPYFLELAAIALLFFVAMDETFGDGRLTRADAAEQLIRLITFGTAPRQQEAATSWRPAAGLALHDRRRLGQSDLWVSPLALEAVDFGAIMRTASTDNIGELFDLYFQHGGNFIETTNYCGHDELERLVGGLVSERRDEMVLATNHRLLNTQGLARNGANYRFRLARSVEEHLGRLGVDCIDLLYLNGLEQGIPAAELVDACDDLIKGGKIRYAGFCDVPAWQVSRLHAVAETLGKKPFVAVRACYGASATVKAEVFDMAGELGMGITTSPIPVSQKPPNVDRLPPLDYSATIRSIANKMGTKPQQVAVAWQFHHPGVVAELIHPHSRQDLEDSIAALQIVFDDKDIEQLNEAAEALIPD